MSFRNLFVPVKLACIPIGLVLLVLFGSAQAQPSQKPLLTRDGGGVKPNIMLTMDDSGSMLFQHMPEETIYVGSFAVASPVGGQSVRMDPSDTETLDGFFIGTIAAQRGTSNYRQKLMRSPDTNTIYYNPEVRYLPWALSTYPLPAATAAKPAGRMANSPVTAAYLDPVDPTGGGVVNLTNVRVVTTTWCYRDSRSDCSSASESYDPGLYFRLKKSAAGAYLDPSVAANYTEYSINNILQPFFPKAATRTDCAGVVGLLGCTQAEERANYANWFTYYRSRNLLARGALVEAFAEVGDTFRLGWGRINNSTSASIDGVNTSVIQSGVRDFTSTTKGNLFKWLYALPANGGTPLPGAMRAVGQYYSRSDNKGPWSDNPGSSNTTPDKSCRRAYHIMVTDGYWNANTTAVGNSDDANGPVITGTGRSYQYLATRPYRDSTSNTLADYAMEYWKKDLRPDSAMPNNVVPSAENPAFWQHMVNFMVGLGVRGTLVPNKLPGGLTNPASDLPALTAGTKSWGNDEIDDLWHSALNSRGEFISAKDPSELASAIKESVGQALQRELREAGVATASTVLQDGNRKYVPLYKTGDWTGDIQTYVLDANGQAGAQVWNAQSKLPAWGSRNIVTWSSDLVPAGGVAFSTLTMGATNLTALGTLTTSPASTNVDLVNFLKGDRSKEGDGKSFRERQGVLGDFINSSPVLVKDAVNMGYSTLPAAQGGSSYGAFLSAKASRTATLFVGGNDGMLHAFKDTIGAVPAEDGKEVFAYVPKTVIANLSKLASKDYGTTSLYHQYYVDGPLIEADAYVNAPGSGSASWRNYLVGSLGSGGRAIFALDVTDTANLGPSSVRWELSSATNGDLGYVSSPAQVGVLPNGEWVAIFGNGSFSNAGKATLFVVNLQTGVAKTLDVGASGGNGLGGVGVVRNTLGQITHLYAGDLKGNLWKFNYLASANSRFEIADNTALFSATHSDGEAQPITQPPAIFDHSQGGKIVVFGTGSLTTDADANSIKTQGTYGVWDKPGDTTVRPLGRSSLEPRSLSAVAGSGGSTFYQLAGTAVDWVNQRGWVINLDIASGMRVVYPPQSVSKSLALISVVKPASSVAVCETATGSGLNLLLPVEQGVNPISPLFDTDGSGVIDASDSLVAGYGTNADGIDAVVRSTPACSGSVCKTRISIQNTTSQMGAIIQDTNPASTGLRPVKDRVWSRIINPPIR
jgi:type IV pilus assembly protein PilY1